MRVLIIGASSGIGKELSLRYASSDNEVIAVARRKPLLQELAQTSPNIRVAQCDIADIESSKALLAQVFTSPIDLAVLCSGVGDLNPDLDFVIERPTLDINVIGWTFFADFIYKKFEEQRYGHLVVISSCGGLRGEPMAPSYSASKAFQMNYAEALCKKAFKSKLPIVVTDIRPGLVNTRMAKGKGLFWVMSVEKVTTQIMAAVAKKRDVAIVTKRWSILHWIMKYLPHSIYKRM
mgnify:CR=1 FL=1